jgi:2-isopropylmalate synthase
MLDDRLHLPSNRSAAYVGERAFAHKGGLHVSAVEKDPRTYEHIEPSLVGNARHIVVSDQAGRSNILARFREIGLEIDANAPEVPKLLDLIKQRENEGYAYDGASASFELLARRMLHSVPDFFELNSFRVITERRFNARGDLITQSEATVKVAVGEEWAMTVAEGNGPVNALDEALRKALVPHYPSLAPVSLIDYKVRILNPHGGTAAITRVMIESQDDAGHRWTCIGVSSNVIDASFNALYDIITYKLFRDGVVPKGQQPGNAAPLRARPL